MSNVTLRERRTRKQKTPVISASVKLAHGCWFNLRFRRALRIASIILVIAFLGFLSSAAFGANPAQEMAKAGATGGINTKGNSWYSIQKSVEQFFHPTFILRLFLSLSFGGRLRLRNRMASAPRVPPGTRSRISRNARHSYSLVWSGPWLLDFSGISQTLAFVIFGIGALLRFRTLLDNPKLTGKAIMVVIVGLACGMGSWAMAVFVTGFLLVTDVMAGFALELRGKNSTRPDGEFRGLSSTPCSRCLFHISASYKAPHFTRTRDAWCFYCTFQMGSTERVWSMK